MISEKIQQPRIYKEAKEEEIREEIDKFIDFLEKLSSEIETKDIDFKDLDKVFTSEKIELMLKYLNNIAEEAKQTNGKKVIVRLLFSLSANLDSLDYLTKECKNLDVNERISRVGRIYGSITSLVAARKYFTDAENIKENK